MHCVFLPIVVTMCQRKLGCSLYVQNCIHADTEWVISLQKEGHIKRTEWLVDSPALSLQIKGSKDCFSDEIQKGSNGLSYFCVNGGKQNTTKYTKQLLKITQIRSFSKKIMLHHAVGPPYNLSLVMYICKINAFFYINKIKLLCLYSSDLCVFYCNSLLLLMQPSVTSKKKERKKKNQHTENTVCDGCMCVGCVCVSVGSVCVCHFQSSCIKI